MTLSGPPTLPEIETPYGMLKRFKFVNSVIEAGKPDAVLDIGCGTGAYLTHPLAQQHGQTDFFGKDSDLASIDLANRSYKLPNTTFSADPDAFEDRHFPLIIASEVLEHVQDPLDFLAHIKDSLSEDGKVILTVPNGYGPFEIAVFFETLLRLTSLYRVFVALARLLRNKRPLFPETNSVSAESLAASPHINFFSLGVLKKLFDASGFEIISFQSRTLLCGPLFDQVVQGLGLQNWNATLADRAAVVFASDWMFVLEAKSNPVPITYRRRLDARVRRYLNEKLVGLR